jgi:Glutamate/Leucine/Phenylalanine/Valine dehydrogenase
MVSYFEWVQNRMGFYWTLDEVNSRLKHKMVEESERIWSPSVRKKKFLCAQQPMSTPSIVWAKRLVPEAQKRISSNVSDHRSFEYLILKTLGYDPDFRLVPLTPNTLKQCQDMRHKITEALKVPTNKLRLFGKPTGRRN